MYINFVRLKKNHVTNWVIYVNFIVLIGNNIRKKLEKNMYFHFHSVGKSRYRGVAIFAHFMLSFNMIH